MMKTFLRGVAAAAALTAFIASANAQTAQPQPPASTSQPSATAPAKPSPMAKPAAKSSAAKKQPSQAQMASRARMKDCAAQWQKAKSAHTTGGKTYKQFSSECLKQQ
jgi:hypothetical protein